MRSVLTTPLDLLIVFYAAGTREDQPHLRIHQDGLRCADQRCDPGPRPDCCARVAAPDCGAWSTPLFPAAPPPQKKTFLPPNPHPPTHTPPPPPPHHRCGHSVAAQPNPLHAEGRPRLNCCVSCCLACRGGRLPAGGVAGEMRMHSARHSQQCASAPPCLSPSPQYPDADVLTSSDHLAPTVKDEGLEQWPQAASGVWVWVCVGGGALVVIKYFKRGLAARWRLPGAALANTGSRP